MHRSDLPSEKPKTYPKDQQMKHGSDWNPFVYGISASIKNRYLEKFPMAKLNRDQSITLILHKCTDAGCKECKETKPFEDSLKAGFILEQLEFQRQEHGFPIIGGGRPLVEETSAYNAVSSLVEYRINLSPEHLDTILKKNVKYTGYKGENSVLKLNKDVFLKPGFIRLFPVWPLSESENLMRAAECQIAEMPGVQLSRLLPDYDSKKEDDLHWMPKDAEKQLNMHWSKMESVINDLLLAQGMIKEKFYIQSTRGITVVSNPREKEGPIRIVPIDEQSRDFYLMYSNLGSTELKSCQSLEVRTMDFFKAIKAKLLEDLDWHSTHQYGDRAKAPVVKESLKVLEQMIATEARRLELEQRAPVVDPGSPSHAAPHASLHRDRKKTHDKEERDEAKYTPPKPTD